MTEEPILSVRELKKHYPLRKGLLNRQVGAARAVDGISFDVHRGETVGLVGESGCGKSTAATSIVRLEEPTEGEVIFNGGGRAGATRNADGIHPNDVTRFDKRELKTFRRDAQMIFQDPSSSFDPRMTIGNTVAEMLLVHGMDDRQRRRAIVEDLLERVGLNASDYDRYPHEFSGGQKQRVALARALVLNPELIIADEPVSALDVSIQAEVLSLIDDLQEQFGLSLLIISHDMSVIRAICDRVAVMYLGEIVEIGDTDELFANPQHPYTEALLSSIPTPDPHDRTESIQLTGTVPDPSNPPSGCRFHTRCHKVVQPATLDLQQDEFRRLIDLRYSLLGGDFDIDRLREMTRAGAAVAVGDDSDSSLRRISDRVRSLVGADTEEPIPPEKLKAQIRAEFDLPEQLSDRTAELALEESLDHLIEGETGAASEALSGTFTTPCEQTTPEYTDHGDGHRSACLLHERNETTAEAVADD